MGTEQTTASQRETLTLFERRREPLGTTEVAAALDLERRTAYARLDRLVERGRLRTKQVGAKARVWWHPRSAEGDERSNSDEGDEHPDRRDEGTRRGRIDETEHPTPRDGAEGRDWSGEDRELYRAVSENVSDGVYALDDGMRFSMVDEDYLDLTGYTREDLLGAHYSTLTPEAATAASRSDPTHLADSDAAEETVLQCADGGHRAVDERFAVLDSDDGPHYGIGLVRDVSGRVEQRRTLDRRRRQQNAITTLGRRALETHDRDELLTEAAELVAETLDNDYCKILDLDSGREDLLLSHGVGWSAGTVGNATVSATEADSQAAYTLGSWQPVVVSDLEAETRFSGPALLTDHDVRSGISTIIGTPDDPWGILGTHDTAPQEFSEHDATFVQSVATVLASAIDRQQYEQELRDRRSQIAVLNNLNRVVSGITADVVEQSTRDEIEQTVCERLADTDSYEFAWIGDVDTSSRTVALRAEAGVDGYLDEVTISVGDGDERSRGPTGRAFRTGEMQTTRRARTDSRYGPWRDVADEYGFRSSAAIPIVHEETIYGVLNVYAARPNAFDGREGEVIAKLGEIVGHAIAAEERKRALLSDEVVELQFRVEDFPGTLGVDVDGSGPIRVEHVVPVGDDEYVLFGRTASESVETVRRIAESVPYYEDLTVREAGDDSRFELVVSEPPVLSTVASLGGSVEEARIEDGDYHLRVYLSPNVEVRRLFDAVSETFPTAALTKRQQRSRRAEGDETGPGLLSDDLTERQRTVVESAYHAGFFEWPRIASGEEVAETLGITPPTFHQHLRKAEKRILDAVVPTSSDERT